MGTLFGTDGVRGLANADLTPELALALGRAAVGVLRDQAAAGPASSRPGRPAVVVGRDPRASAKTNSTRRHSSMRRPRVAGSTPQISTSWRSSPPMPTPKIRRPGASWPRSESWRATSTG